MLKKHLKSHLNLRPYNCTGCSFSFKTKGNLTKHLKTMAHHAKMNGGSGSRDLENPESRDENVDGKNSANEDESDETLSDEGLEIVTDDENFDDSPPDGQKWQLTCDSGNDLNQNQSTAYQNLWERIKNGIYFNRQCRTPFLLTPPLARSLLDDNSSGHVTTARCPSAPSTTTTAAPSVGAEKFLAPPKFGAKNQSIKSNVSRDDTKNWSRDTKSWSRDAKNWSRDDDDDAATNPDCVLVIASPPPAQNDDQSEIDDDHVTGSNDDHLTSIPGDQSEKPDEKPTNSMRLSEKSILTSHVTTSSDVAMTSSDGAMTSSDGGMTSSDRMTSSSSIMTSSGSKKQCEICGKQFARPGLYELHREVHRFEKSSSRRYDYKCSYCMASCRSKNLLHKHLQVAHQEKQQQQQKSIATQSRDSAETPNGPILSPNLPPANEQNGLQTNASGHQMNANLLTSGSNLLAQAQAGQILLSPESSNDPRPFKCQFCKLAFRIHGHLAKHLRSKTHIMNLENMGEVDLGTFSLLEESKCDKYAQIDTSDCRNSIESLRRIRAEIIAEKQQHHNSTNQGAPQISSISQQASPKNGLILSPRKEEGHPKLASNSSNSSSLLCSEQFLANSPPILINNDQQPIKKQHSDFHSSNPKMVVADLWIPPKEAPPTLNNNFGCHSNLSSHHGNAGGSISGCHGNATGNHGNAAGNHGNGSGNHGNGTGYHGNAVLASADHQNQKDICKFCDLAFPNSTELEIHWHSDHVIMRDGPYFKCPKPNCDTVYPTRQNLRNHLASHYYNNSNNSSNNNNLSQTGGLNGTQTLLSDSGVNDFSGHTSHSRDVSRATVVALSRKIIGGSSGFLSSSNSSGLAENNFGNQGSSASTSTNGGGLSSKRHNRQLAGGPITSNLDNNNINNSSPPQPISDSEASRQSTASSSRSLSPTPPSRPASKRNSSSVDTDLGGQGTPSLTLMTSGSRGLGGVKRRLVAAPSLDIGGALDAPSTPTPPVLAAPVPLLPHQRPLVGSAHSAPTAAPALNHQLAAAVWNLLNNAAVAAAVGATPPLSPQSAAAAAAFVNQQQQQQITLQQQQAAAAALAAAKFAWPQQPIAFAPGFLPTNGVVGGGASLPTVASLASIGSLAPIAASLAPIGSLALLAQPPSAAAPPHSAAAQPPPPPLPASIFSLENLRCIKCQKQFYSPMAVQEHIVQAHSEAVRLHVCPFCDAGFTTPRALAAHLPCKQQHQMQQQMR